MKTKNSTKAGARTHFPGLKLNIDAIYARADAKRERTRGKGELQEAYDDMMLCQAPEGSEEYAKKWKRYLSAPGADLGMQPQGIDLDAWKSKPGVLSSYGRKRAIAVSLGALEPPLTQQLNGCLSKAKADILQQDAAAIDRLYVRGLLLDGETERVRRRLIQKIQEAVSAK